MADVGLGRQPILSPDQDRERPATDREPAPTNEAPWSNASAQDALPRDPGSVGTPTLDSVGYGASVGGSMPCDACHEPLRVPPVDQAAGVRPRNPKVDALYPEGWWDRGKGSNAHAMSASDEFGSGGGIDPELRGLGEGPEVRGMHIEKEPRVPEPGATRPAISELDVDLKSGEARHFRDIVGDGLERDHWPSFAAVVQALEDRIGAPLDADLKAFLYENTNTIAIDDAMHLMRRTTGGKNTPAQIAADAADLRRAFEADAEDFRRLALAQDLDPKEVEDAIDAMRELNEEMGIYTWVQ